MRKFRSGLTWREPSFMRKMWDLTWGLVLVAGLTAISEFGLRVEYSKTPPDAPVVSQPMVHAVK
jgi:hypothetical protein